MHRKETDRKIFGAIGLIWLLALLFGLYIRGDGGLAIDYLLLGRLHEMDLPLLNRLMHWITITGDPLFYVVVNAVLIVILARQKKYPELICLLAAVLVGWGLNEALKAAFVRTRPVGFALIEQGGFSYPSGHAMVALSWYPVAGYLLQYRRPYLAIAWQALFIYGFLPGLSRLFLGVHYPTDVLFGHLLGLTLSYLCMRGYATYKRKQLDS